MPIRYAELHCKTNFSFLEGAAHAVELAEQAATLGYAGLAITDENTLAGMVRAHMAAGDAKLPLIVGTELSFEDTLSATVWTPDRPSYGQLSRLLTTGRRRAPKGECRLRWSDWEQHHAAMLAGLLPPDPWDEATLLRELRRWQELLGDRLYLLAHALRGAADLAYLERLAAVSRQTGVPLVAAGDVRYHVAQRKPLHDVLTAIRRGETVAETRGSLTPNAEHHLRPLSELESLYATVPGALERTIEVLQRCPFSLNELRFEYPRELAPVGKTPFQHLEELTWAGAARRYPQGVPAKVQALVRHELQLIEEMRYEAYFLTVWDMVQFARGRDILCQGRGSAANSAVCFCLEITSVDPDRTDVLFERFVSRERNEAPDIDVDFEHQRREEVLQYLYDKYGRERAGMTAAVITYRARSAVRDVGKALGISLDVIDRLAKNVERSGGISLADRCQQMGLDSQTPLGRQFVELTEQLIGFPRHLSQHVGGMVMTRGPLCELAPIENAAMPGRTVLQWDKDDLDELGILKVDCLALGMLTAIHKCFDLIARHWNRQWTLASVPAEDPVVYDMICEADTMGVFQIESRAQMSMLPRLRPREFYDLVIEVAIVRPGPIQGDMVHPYLRRRAGEEQPVYPNEAIRQVLHKTLGVPLFQEQAMRLAVVAAGFTPGEADQLRRAMGAWRRPGVIDQFHQKLLDGMRRQGLSDQFAELVFHQIRGFGEYGFPESHAASFALLVYVSAWLKRHYPEAFLAALLNSQPMGFYGAAQLVRDAREHQVRILPPDVNYSDWDCLLEDLEQAEETRPAVRLGLRLISGLPQAAANQLMEARQQGGSFAHLDDLALRAKLTPAVLRRLADADALQSLRVNRRQALWDSLATDVQQQHRQPLFAGQSAREQSAVALPQLSDVEEVFADYRTTGLSLKGHPLQFYRHFVEQLEAVPLQQLRQLEHDSNVCVAGIVLLRQRPATAKGITFVTIEDETAAGNLVLHSQVWEKFGMITRHSPAWLVRGKLERRGPVIHIVVKRLQDLSQAMQNLKTHSRDFR